MTALAPSNPHSRAPQLIVAPQWIGDAVMAIALIRTLAQAGETVLVLATPWTAAIFQSCPFVSRVFVFPARRRTLQWRARRAFARETIAPWRCSHAYILPNSWKSALIPYFAGIPLRVGYRGEWRRGLINRQIPSPPDAHQAYRYRALCTNPPPPRSGILPESELPQLTLNDSAVDLQSFAIPTHPIAALCIGAEFGPAKQWRGWNALAQRLIHHGFHVIILGTDKEIHLENDIVESLASSARGAVTRLCGKTQITQVLALVRQSTLVFSNDSGLAHVSAAMKKPLMVFFGSTDERATAPLGYEDIPTKIFFRQDLSCRPCLARTCRYGHYQCLVDIHIDEVWQAVLTLFPQPHFIDGFSIATPAIKSRLRSVAKIRRQQAMQQQGEAINRQMEEKLFQWLTNNLAHPIGDRFLGVYVPMADEINLTPLWHRLRAQGWKLALPSRKEEGSPLSNPSMVYRHWHNETPLASLPHLNLGKQLWVQGDGEVLQPLAILIPCLGFNAKKFRLGYGGGFFDRYLSAHPQVRTLGIALDECQFTTDFQQAHDQPLMTILTPSQTFSD